MSNLVDSLNRFGFETLQRTNPPNDTENTVFSPYSAFVCVAMSNSLFKNETRDEILKSLQIYDKDTQVTTILQHLRELIEQEKTEKVSVSNRIWANENLNFSPSTFSPNEQILKIPIEKTLFPQPGCDRINEEVNQTTHGMIPKLVNESDLDPMTALVLLNAIYFKSEWEKPFNITHDSSNPQSKNFTLANGTQIHVNMLESFSRRLPYTEDNDFQIVSIPYLENKYEFIIVLPKENSKAGYEKLTKLTYEQLNDNLLSKMSIQKVDIKLPKFTFETTINLNDIFQSLGMKRAFTLDAECTDPNVSYFVSKIIQKAKIILDEKGTEAAAATAMIMLCGCCLNPPPTPEIFADHPFAYFLRNTQTNSILFEGFVKNPAE